MNEKLNTPKRMKRSIASTIARQVRQTLVAALAGAVVLTTLGTTAATADPPNGAFKPKLERERHVPQLRVEPRAKGLHVRVWTDVGDGGVAYPGQSISVSFKTNRDAYVAIYNVDTRGKKTVLFPRGRRLDGFVYGGETIRLPGPRANYDLVVRGPRGIERVVAVASDRPIGRRPWEFDDHAWYPTRGGGSAPYPEFNPYATSTRLAGSQNPRFERIDHIDPESLSIEPRRRGRGSERFARDETWFDVERRCWW